MKMQFQAGIRPGLSLLGASVLCASVLAGCGSSSPPASSSTTASRPTTQTSSPSAEKPDTTAADAAQAPQRKPPAGLGNAIGRVLFDGKGAPGIEVQLCEQISLVGGCGGKTYQAKTDAKGFYIIDKVKPGSYGLAVRVFNSNQFIYPTSGVMSAAQFKVEKDNSLAVRTVNLWKTDLQIATPKNGGTVKTDKPTLSWKAYPSAANYKISVRTKQGVGSLANLETSETSIVPDKSLLNGDYQWRVEAFNGDGTKLAETNRDATFKVVGQAGSNTVDLVNPKQNTTVAAAGLTLQWKAHPQAEEYRVYLKGVKAADPILSFESLNATSYKLPTPPPADQYFWSVEAFKGGERVAGSALERFTIK